MRLCKMERFRAYLGVLALSCAIFSPKWPAEKLDFAQNCAKTRNKMLLCNSPCYTPSCMSLTTKFKKEKKEKKEVEKKKQKMQKKKLRKIINKKEIKETRME